MKRAGKIFLLSVCLLLVTMGAALAAPKVPADARIVVAGIGYQGQGADEHTRSCLAEVATEIAGFYLKEDTKWDVEMLEDRASVLAEQGLSLSSNINGANARKIGQEQKADYVLFGNIVGMGIDYSGEYVGPIFNRETQKADARISLSLIDARTGNIVAHAVAEGSSQSNSGSALQALAMFIPGFTGYYFNNQAVSEELLNNAVEGGVESVVMEMLDKLAIKHPQRK